MITDIFSMLSAHNCQSVSASRTWRAAKCSSSPTDELSYSEKLRISARPVLWVYESQRCTTHTLAVDNVRPFFRSKELGGVREIDKDYNVT